MSFKLYYYPCADIGQCQFLVEIPAQICGAIPPQAHRIHNQLDVTAKPRASAFEEPLVSNG
jgi:hypothetical protein